MDRVKLAHVMSTVVKGLSLISGFAVYAHFLPAVYAGPAILAFAVASWLKDLVSSTEKKLESSEPLLDVAVDTAKEAVDSAATVKSGFGAPIRPK